jgi:hypothetical protein
MERKVQTMIRVREGTRLTADAIAEAEGVPLTVVAEEAFKMLAASKGVAYISESHPRPTPLAATTPAA